MKPAQRTIVLGGGISGLAAAKALLDSGQDCIVLERCPTVGGLTRTVEVGDFCFDYTGHFLHLSRYETPADIPYAGLNNDDWQSITRRSVCHVGGRFITAPIQYHVGALPVDMLAEFKKTYDRRPVPPQESVATFRDYIISGFGRYLADLFLIPQNEKTMATSLGRLSVNAVKRFFPPPDEQRIRAGMEEDSSAPSEYNASFWYPKVGGIESLVRGLSAGVKNIITNQEVVSLDLASKTLHTNQCNRFGWNVLLSSIPLKILCRATSDPDMVAAADKLTNSSTISFNFGVRGTPPSPLEEVHWIYFPERSVPFYRVGFYSNISPGTCALGYHSMYVEVGVDGGAIDRVNVQDLQSRVLKSLEALHLLRPDNVVCSVVNIIRCAYVHHTAERDEIIDYLLTRLEAAGIFPIGRYGLWDYTSMEDSIESAISTVRRLGIGNPTSQSGRA